MSWSVGVSRAVVAARHSKAFDVHTPDCGSVGRFQYHGLGV